MKTVQFLSLALILILAFSSFRLKPAPADDGYYAFIVVDGVHKNKVGYASRIIQYPGYDDCNKRSSSQYFREAQRAFSNYLEAHFHDAFPYGGMNDLQLVDMKRHSTTELLKTRAQAEQRLTEWIADQKSEGNKVQTTNFSYSCSN